MAQTTSVALSGDGEPVSERVISAVADLTDADPVAMDPLYTVVDPEALDALFDPAPLGRDRSPNRVEFTYNGCEVVVSGDGTVRISSAGTETA